MRPMFFGLFFLVMNCLGGQEIERPKLWPPPSEDFRKGLPPVAERETPEPATPADDPAPQAPRRVGKRKWASAFHGSGDYFLVNAVLACDRIGIAPDYRPDGLRYRLTPSGTVPDLGRSMGVAAGGYYLSVKMRGAERPWVRRFHFVPLVAATVANAMMSPIRLDVFPALRSLRR